MDHRINSQKYLIVSGDFSGIQNTVYTISSKGALKSLRARSFMLELLTEHIVYEILTRAGYKTDEPEEYLIRMGKGSGVIFSGGGAFSLLLENENIPALKGCIEEFTGSLNDWALKEFFGSLFIAIHCYEISDDQLTGSGFQNIRNFQAEAIENIKRKKFWDSDGILLKKLLTPLMPKKLNNDEECQITRRDDLDTKELFKNSGLKATRLSCLLWNLGDRLIDAKYIYRYKKDDVSNLKEEDSYLYLPTIDNQIALYTVEKNQHANSQKKWEIGKDFLYANYARKVIELPEYAQQVELNLAQKDDPKTEKENIKNNAASFSGLAACSCGADLIGALRMDVDNLGKLFSAEIDSSQKLAKLSYQVNYFFKVNLNHICKGNFNEIKLADGTTKVFANTEGPLDILGKLNKAEGANGRNVTIVYAGGDDMFIVGAWDEITELSFDIHRCFNRYCELQDIKLNGEVVTISGGLTLHEPKYPLYQMAKLSGDAEHCAKHDDADRKNRIAFYFDENKRQRQRRLVSKGKEKDEKRKTDYMLSMDWNTATTYFLRLMQEFNELGEYMPSSVSYRPVFRIDKISYQTIEKWFSVIDKFHTSGQLYVSSMAHVMSDVHKMLEHNGKSDLFQNLLTLLYINNKGFPHFHIALNWLSFIRRRR